MFPIKWPGLLKWLPVAQSYFFVFAYPICSLIWSLIEFLVSLISLFAIGYFAFDKMNQVSCLTVCFYNNVPVSLFFFDIFAFQYKWANYTFTTFLRSILISLRSCAWFGRDFDLFKGLFSWYCFCSLYGCINNWDSISQSVGNINSVARLPQNLQLFSSTVPCSKQVPWQQYTVAHISCPLIKSSKNTTTPYGKAWATICLGLRTERDNKNTMSHFNLRVLSQSNIWLFFVCRKNRLNLVSFKHWHTFSLILTVLMYRKYMNTMRSTQCIVSVVVEQKKNYYWYL